ncbi:hypothetical protein BY458DRAFT_13745 [Sporodiniella umbellata]|nr:hypothetical protein BY458DRAFT_13745 [Sporodiniella umbellata]
MPQLVSTRCAKLKTLQQDKVQWALTRHRSKTYSPKSSNTNVESDSMNTLAIAKKLIVMLSCQNFVELSLVAQKIRKLYKIVKFSSRACIDYLVQNTSESHMGDMLLLYYQLSLYLKDTLALRLNTLLQKVPIVTLDKALCDLLNRSEDAAKAYIYHLTPEQLEYFYMMDLEGFLNNTIDKEKTKRLHYLLYRYQESWETCLYKILLRDQTRNDTQETKEKIYDKAIEKAKRKHIFEDCHHQETERDLQYRRLLDTPITVNFRR